MTMMKNIRKSPNLIQMTKKMIGTHIVTIVVRAVFMKIITNVYIKYKMIYYDRINVSEGVDFNKTSASKECDICHD